MFPFWDRPSETERAAMQAARAEQVAEHEAAVERLREAQETGGVTPAPDDLLRTSTQGGFNDGPKR